MSDENVGGTGLSAARLRELGLEHLIPREPSSWEREERARQTKLGERYGLTFAEVQAAELLDMTLEDYAAMRGVATLDDFEHAQLELADRHEAREQLRREAVLEDERRRSET